METTKFSVNQQLISTVLSWIESDDIAIPEIQRPFVWDATKVRDLIDSLYNGYPIGYLIACFHCRHPFLNNCFLIFANP
jgi:uncharacterized protein with ParB-like and HNH nuclease domain